MFAITRGLRSAAAAVSAAGGGTASVFSVPGYGMLFTCAQGRVLDEIQIHQIPVLLGAGRRLSGILPSPTELEIVRVIGTPQATHIRYRVHR